ncbi:ROK family protein [Bacillus sp. FJAT-42376]|uniref:ROK family protein n=1 Tax=Bacillus sp. FJAT-42376 TaxID=2014076 RepID=UPI000F4E5D70|nr:ROK family protein [Bacillus sp. FJAT-42376]AZB41691.1 ROK family protein [Bacillus sp. FJAT-42376]
MAIGAIEAGGTKFVCGVGTVNGDITEHCQIPTGDPEETLEQVIAFFSDFQLEALGVGTFGPADLDETSASYGSITTTPKLKWMNFPLYSRLKQELGVQIAFDTDVNAAALGELTWGAAQGLDSCMYMTVGTGIGVGAVVKGELLHGMSHPEMGHILVRRHPDDSFRGSCPYHGDCLEGLAAGPALEKRWGSKGDELANRAEVWEIEADYIAQALVNYALILNSKRLILGGGVMRQRQLFPLIRKKFGEYMNGYIQNPYVDNLDTYIVPPALKDFSGLKGALALAGRTLAASSLHP